jgi:hypothetical protein
MASAGGSQGGDAADRGEGTCRCSSFTPIELDRNSVSQRIKETPRIRKSLERIAENEQLRISLFRCPTCRQMWQSGHEWNFGDKEYVFQVPTVEIPDWMRDPFQQPAAMMIYSAGMERFFRQEFVETADPCRSAGCSKRAIRFSVLCLDHHIESLQQIGNLPKPPVGRMFPPYFNKR